jgi:hypothetical protein
MKTSGGLASASFAFSLRQPLTRRLHAASPANTQIESARRENAGHASDPSGDGAVDMMIS